MHQLTKEKKKEWRLPQTWMKHDKPEEAVEDICDIRILTKSCGLEALLRQRRQCEGEKAKLFQQLHQAHGFWFLVLAMDALKLWNSLLRLDGNWVSQRTHWVWCPTELPWQTWSRVCFSYSRSPVQILDNLWLIARVTGTSVLAPTCTHAWVTSQRLHNVQEPERLKEASDGVLPSSSDESSWP